MSSLAARLGLSTMTVSRALRNARGVSIKTRARVLRSAHRFNYTPDPVLAALNSYRHGRHQATSQAKIVFLTNFPSAEGWRSVPTFVRYFEGICNRARVLGYEVEPFWIGDPKLTHARASQILSGRGIRGIIIGPLAQGMSALQLNWNLFSAVAVGRSLAEPRLATVSCNHFQSVELAWHEAWRRGYRRIGLALTVREDIRTVGSLQASYLLRQRQSEASSLPIFLTPDFSVQQLVDWATTNQPDVLLSSEPMHHQMLTAAKSKLFPRPRFVHLNVDPKGEQAGIDQGHDKVGEHAAALLHLKILQQETGIPAQRDLLLIDGRWKEGIGKWRLDAPRTRARKAQSHSQGGPRYR